MAPAAFTSDLSPQALVDAHYAPGTSFLPDTVGAEDVPVKGLEQSGPQGKVQPYTLVDDPAAWRAKDFPDLSRHAVHLSADDIAEVDSALARAVDTGKEVHQITRDDFPLPNLGPKLAEWRDEVRFGKGWFLLRGVPVERYSLKDSAIVYWGFGLYWAGDGGRVCSQNAKGHILGHVKDIGFDPKKPDTRVYGTNLAQPFHTDGADIVGLLCIRPSKSGGESSWSSSVSVHNELLRIGRRDLVETLAGEWYLDRKSEIPEGKKPFFQIPIFNYHDGYLTTHYSATYYELAQRHAEVPRLTEEQKEAIRYFNALARSDALRLDYVLQPGDIQLLSNHMMLHTRSKFEDYPEPERRRHLMRLWVSPPPPDRPLPESFAELYDSTEVGKRGGIHVPGYKLTTPLDGE